AGASAPATRNSLHPGPCTLLPCSHMRRIICLVVVLVSAAMLRAQAPDASIRLIVQADDMGAAHGINVATLDAYHHGIVRSTNVIMPSPWVPEAAALLKQTPGIEVGVHLALTSEWTSIKWRPLTHAPSLVNENGYFFPMIWPGEHLPAGHALKEHSADVGEIEREMRAQIELAKKLIPHVSYASENMGFDAVAPGGPDLVMRLMWGNGLVVPGD